MPLKSVLTKALLILFTVFFAQSLNAQGYCASYGEHQIDEFISRVQLAGIDNPSGLSQYSDFTPISTDLIIGSSNTITITPTWISIDFVEGYAVWIDYNQDDDFWDAGELVWSNLPVQGTTPVSGNFTVPASAIANLKTKHYH